MCAAFYYNNNDNDNDNTVCSLALSFVFFFFGLFFNRHVESTVEPRYAPVDQQAHVLGPRVLPSGHPTDNGPRRGPLDPSVPYALPQKKNKPKKPRHEPAIGK